MADEDRIYFAKPPSKLEAYVGMVGMLVSVVMLFIGAAVWEQNHAIGDWLAGCSMVGLVIFALVLVWSMRGIRVPSWFG